MEESFELNFQFKQYLNHFSFGVIVNNKTFVSHFTSDSDIEVIHSLVVFENDRKRILLQFETFCEQLSERNETTSSSSDSGQESETKRSIEWMFEKYEFVINFSQIKSIHFDCNYNNLFLVLAFPPLLYNVCKEENSDFDQNVSEVDDNQDFYNSDNEIQTNYDNGFEEDMDGFEDDKEKNIIVMNDIEDNKYKSLEEENRRDFSGFRLRVTNFNGIDSHDLTKINSIRLQLKDKSSIKEIIANIQAFDPLIVMSEERNGYEVIDHQTIVNQDLFYAPNGLPFNIEYSLQALIDYSYHFIDSLIVNTISFREFIQLVKEFCAINSTAVEYSLNDLQKSVENGLAINPYYDLIELFVRHNVKKPEKWTNSSVMFVRRCILTPTRLLLLPALPQQQSRFLRTCNPDFAIRVLIKDEDFQSLSFSACKTSLPDNHEFVQRMRQFLWQTIKNRIVNGIEIGGRIYELIGASTSQLRDHGLVLYARDDRGRNAQQICQEIGEFTGIRNPAKFIARIGLSMSQSMGFVSHVNCVQTIEDITGGEHKNTGEPYVFSDGVGMISQAMAAKFMSAINRSNYFPSTFQIRFAGFKGILVINPELKGEKICVRESMKKFESSSTELDILKVSEPRSVYLNRPLITILNQMGVTNEQLLRLQFDRLKELSIAFSCNCKAIELIKSYSTLKLPYNKLLESGIDVLNEPLFVNIMESIIRKVSLDLRNKARILIPLNQGRVMFGVLDETQTLEYGQVFVQYSHQENGSKIILNGEILVTKYPCMHAGDVRKLIAVDVPALHHIIDCIVFPSKGQRPHPDEMAGSDLDGDEYSVIWYKPLIFKRKNSDPMHFPCGEAQDWGHEVTVDDILEFYCNFIENNHVGIIASSHLAWADYNEAGIFSRICDILDHKYAVALDYAKTGINQRLQNRQKPSCYPDFMMKFHEKPTYKSRKGLGKLYQTSCYFNELIEDIAQQNAKNFNLNEKLVDKNADIYMSDAEVMFDMYRNAIIDLKEQFGIDSESALISGSFTKTHKYLCTQNDSNDTHDLVSNIINKLFDDLKYRFETGVNEEMRLAKASAWYQISVKRNNQTDDKYFSFPWIVSEYLAKLALKNSSLKHDCSVYSIQFHENLDKSIKLTKENIQTLVKRYIIYSLREKIFLGLNSGSTQNSEVEEYLKKVVHKVLSDCNDKEFAISSSLHRIFNELTDNIEHYDNDEMILKVSVIALMANYRMLRLGIIDSLKHQSTQLSNNQLVFTAVITEKLSQIIQNNEEMFKSKIKEKTGIKQIKIRFGRKGQDHCISVMGHKSSIDKFKAIIISRYLCIDLKKGDF